jgi:hypothetical protein
MSYENEPPSRTPDPLLQPPPGITLSAFFEHIPLETIDPDADEDLPSDEG